MNLYWAGRPAAEKETGEQCQAASAGRANKPHYILLTDAKAASLSTIALKVTVRPTWG